MSITISFEPDCSGWERENYSANRCVCDRCVTLRGDTPNEHTRILAKVGKAIQKFDMDESLSIFRTKTGVEDKIGYTKFAIRDLIRELSWILDPPDLDQMEKDLQNFKKILGKPE